MWSLENDIALDELMELWRSFFQDSRNRPVDKFGKDYTAPKCNVCEGTGEENGAICPKCKGKGIDELFKGIMNKYEELDATGHILKRQKIRYRLRVKKIIQEKILNKFWTKKKITKLNSATESINDLKKSPIITAKEIMENIDI